MSSPEGHWELERSDGHTVAPQWLPDGIQQAATGPTTTTSSSSRTHADFRWDEPFWEEPESVGEELIREDVLVVAQINNFAGHFEHGKTMIVGDIAHRWARNHGPVLYLDWEMGARRVRRRAKAHGWTWDLVESSWYYGNAPRLDQIGATLPDIASGIMADRDDELLIVMDSFSAAMMAHGKEENSATDVGGWWDAYLRPVTESHGATIALISQVSQNATQTSSYAQRGSGATAFGSDVIWMVERMREFSPEEAGEVRLTRHKDREGVLPLTVGYDVGGGGYESVPVTKRSNATMGAPANVIRQQRILAALDEGGPASPSSIDPSVNYPTMVAELSVLEKQGKIVLYDNPNGNGRIAALASAAPVNAPRLD